MQNMMEITDDLIHIAVSRFMIGSEQVRYIGGLQNIVYEYMVGNISYILRLTPSVNRNEVSIQAELDWIIYLAEKGVSVSKPIFSKNDLLTETIELADGRFYFCAVFEKAQGGKVGYPDCLHDNDLYVKLGRLTGKLHALSKEYLLKDCNVKRHDWRQNWFLQNIQLIPSSQAKVRASYNNLLEEIAALPRDEYSFGLIHGDINVGNFHITEQGIITLFDFDEAQYSWFVEDIAIQLYYLVYVYGGDDGRSYREEQAIRFMEHFMKGYMLENKLDEYWMNQIPLFLRLRELIVYIGSFRNWDGDETFSSSNNQWLMDWISESKTRIEAGIPIVNIWG